MDLYIIRHAIAHPLGQKNEFTDEKRALTSDGRDRMRDAARGLKKMGVELDLLLTSPLVRAVETAEIVAGALGLGKKEMAETVNLAPGASAEDLFAEIKRRNGAESIGLVGHQPDLGMLVARIIQCGDNFGVQLKKGSVCMISVLETVPTLRGDLIWMVTPKQLRMFSKL